MCHARGVEVVIDSHVRDAGEPPRARRRRRLRDPQRHQVPRRPQRPARRRGARHAPSTSTPVRDAIGVLGGVIDAHAAYLLLRGLKTLAVRMERHNANGLRVATLARGAPARAPGLVSRASRATPITTIAARTMRGFGGVVTFELDADARGRVPLHRRVPDPVHRAEPRRRREPDRGARADVVLGQDARAARRARHPRLARAPLGRASRTPTT